MTQEERQLLFKDLCARLPYGVKVETYWDFEDKKKKTFPVKNLTTEMLKYYIGDESYKFNTHYLPFLRPMSSMTDDERKEYESFIFTQHHEWDGHGTSTEYVEIDDAERYVTWLNKNMFDYRGLIPMGLAIEAKEGMYKN